MFVDLSLEKPALKDVIEKDLKAAFKRELVTSSDNDVRTQYSSGQPESQSEQNGLPLPPPDTTRDELVIAALQAVANEPPRFFPALTVYYLRFIKTINALRHRVVIRVACTPC